MIAGPALAGGAGGVTGGAWEPELTKSRRCLFEARRLAAAASADLSEAGVGDGDTFVPPCTNKLNVDTGRIEGFLQTRDNGITRPF